MAQRARYEYDRNSKATWGFEAVLSQICAEYMLFYAVKIIFLIVALKASKIAVLSLYFQNDQPFVFI